MTTWYKQSGSNVWPVNVIRETGKFVIVANGERETREAKTSIWGSYFPTRLGAEMAALASSREHYARLTEQVESAKKDLDRVTAIVASL